MLILKVRNGGFFVGPKHWLVDNGTHYDFQVGFVRRRIFKSSIDSFYELSGVYVGLALPILAILFLFWCLLLASYKGTIYLIRMLSRF